MGGDISAGLLAACGHSTSQRSNENSSAVEATCDAHLAALIVSSRFVPLSPIRHSRAWLRGGQGNKRLTFAGRRAGLV